MKQEECPYEVVVWFSARDVDLLDTGPKAVRPKGLSASDFAKVYTKLVGYNIVSQRGSEAEGYLSKEMSQADDFVKLFIFDNFETTINPIELYRWIDTYIRPPNKVLITSRERSFTGDYAVQVSGMSEDECRKLIQSNRLLKNEF